MAALSFNSHFSSGGVRWGNGSGKWFKEVSHQAKILREATSPAQQISNTALKGPFSGSLGHQLDNTLACVVLERPGAAMSYTSER